MSHAWRRACARLPVFSLLAFALTTAVAFQVRQKASRFDALVIEDFTATLDVATMSVDSLLPSDPARTGWDRFRAAYGNQWSVSLDRRSGAPMLVEGDGIPWIPGTGNSLASTVPVSLESLESSLRSFVTRHHALLMADDSQLVLNRAASGQIGPDLWQVVFDRIVAGVPVAGERYLFAIGHGNLIQFGAPRWSRIDTSPVPTIDADGAMTRLAAYMGLTPRDVVKVLDGGSLLYVPLRAGGIAAPAGPYAGVVGEGYGSTLAWRVALRVDGDSGNWTGLVDAHSGAILALFDDVRYAQTKGGVYPVSDDQIPPDGVEHAGYPMPYANITIGASVLTTNSIGVFSCAPGGSTATTTLAGPYVKVSDTCGPVSQSVTCGADLDLGVSSGMDCTVPAGASAGDTHSSRTSFYHLNRIAEHGRTWLPANVWLTQQLTDNIDLNQTCNAYWDGAAVNFFKSGSGCNNTGEIAGVFLHEWGHGLDENDGGGYDNPSEAYADVTALISTHVSCVGRGFYQSGNCSGYGDACLSCTGIRDQDWNMHASHTPATPSGFVSSNCGTGGGPCGKEPHCEGYVSAETMWDLAVRDLPAAGLDAATSWQLADKLWYKSRSGSGGNAYNCSLPSSDGCAATSWFSKLRAVDDDDGNLANGTPHAAAIFAAFNRHKIACGAAGDASNQSTSGCPALVAPALTIAAGSASAVLTWTAVPGAASYTIVRNDAGCEAGSTAVATVNAPTTTFTDTGLVNGFTEFYHVYANGSNAACDGALSNCSPATPQPFAGTVSLDASTYSCDGTIVVTVIDANIGGPTATVSLTSTSEPGGETVTVTQVAPGSADYNGTIGTTANAPGNDGLLSVADGNAITATYVDADDGQGGHNLTRTAGATADCAFPVISSVQSSNVTGDSARITWSTNEASTTVVHYGLTPPPRTSSSSAARGTAHTSDLLGLTECSTYVYSVESADAVGNSAVDDHGGAYYTFETGKNVVPSYVSTDGPVAIPDNNVAGASSIINVPDAKTVLDVNVTVNITHTYDGDLALYLIAPNGTQVTLSNHHGSGGHNYTNTTFDDEATTPMSSGAPPYTGSFKPDAPLSVVDGISAAGAWKLKVVDGASADVGTIDSWTLTLTFPSTPCGPHAAYRSHALVADTCSAGGPGNGNGVWEAGEQVQFKVNVTNDGTVALTDVTATVAPTTTGLTMVQGTASYPDLAVGASTDSIAPHFTVQLPPSLPCGTVLAFQMTVVSDQGSWTTTFNQQTGQLLSVLNEDFSGGIPGTWTIVDGGSGGGAASTWTTSNPGARSFTAPLVAPVAIVDSDNAGTSATQDEQMITPVLNYVSATLVTLSFDQYFNWYSGGTSEIADVDVKSSLTGGAWANVLRQQNASSPNPDHKAIDITAKAAGASDVQIRFHYYQANYEWWWEVDNVRVDFTAPSGCDQNVCQAPGCASAPDGTSCDDGNPCTVGDACLAESCNPGVLTPPPEVSGITIGGSAPTTLSWTGQGAGTVYDVASSTLSALHASGIGSAACLSNDQPATSFVDSAAVPAGDGVYYLVRAQSACGTGTYGGGTDPGSRDSGITAACP